MRVFVTGATGFVGQEILRQLHAAGHSICILVRRPDSPRVRQVMLQHGVQVHPGNVLDAASLPHGIKGVEAVIHLAGIISEIGENTFENVHTRGTENMVAAAQLADVRRFIHMSALGTRPGAASRYHQTKWAAEEAVRRSGLDFTIFRPSLIFGPGDQFVNVFAKIIHLSPIVPILGSPEARFQPVAVGQVAKAFVAAPTEPKSIGQTYDLCGSETLTLAEIIDATLAAMRRKRLKVHLPAFLARCQAAFLEFVCPRLLGKAPPLNRDQLIMLEEDNVGDPQPANVLFGLQDAPFQEAIREVLSA
jgi:NADH dehydrogenase